MAKVAGEHDTVTAGAARSPIGPAASRHRPLTTRLSAGHLVMIVAGLLGALLSLAVLRASDHRIEVAVAASDLRPGTTVSRDSFRFTRVAMDSHALSRMVRPGDVHALEGSVVAMEIREGEPVTRSALLRPAAPARQRSLSIPVTPERAVGGDLEAGDRIDVLSTDPESSGLVVAGLRVLDIKRSGGALSGGDDKLAVVVALQAAEAERLAPVLGGDKFVLVLSTGAEQVSVGPPPGPTSRTATTAVSRGSSGG